MPYQLPPLPYPNNALEPHIDARTMEIHHDKHHAAYVNNVNKAIEGTEWDNKPIEELIKDIEKVPEKIRTAVRNNGGGHANHSMFWTIMGPNKGGQPERQAGRGDRSATGRLRNLQEGFQRGRRGTLRQRLGLAQRRQEQEAGRGEHPEPG